MHNFDIVLPGRLCFDQDPGGSNSPDTFRANPDFQRRLSVLYKAYRRFGVCGTGETKRIDGIVYRAICGSDYQLRVSVQILISARHTGQQPAVDDLWKLLQNALTMPSPHLDVPGASSDEPVYALGVCAAQFCGFSIEVTPCHALENDRVPTVIRVTALPPSCHELSRAVAG